MRAGKVKGIGGLSLTLAVVVLYIYAWKHFLNIEALLSTFQLLASEIGLLLLYQGF